MTIKELQRELHETARNKGFWDRPRERGTVLMLIVSELAEALEADRRGDMEGLAEELADAVIRCLDAAEAWGIDLEEEILKKHEYNRTRPRLHGKLY